MESCKLLLAPSLLFLAKALLLPVVALCLAAVPVFGIFIILRRIQVIAGLFCIFIRKFIVRIVVIILLPLRADPCLLLKMPDAASSCRGDDILGKINDGSSGNQHKTDDDQNDLDKNRSEHLQIMIQQEGDRAGDHAAAVFIGAASAIDISRIVKRRVLQIPCDQFTEYAQHKQQDHRSRKCQHGSFVILVRCVVKNCSKNKHRQNICRPAEQSECYFADKRSHRSQESETGEKQKYHQRKEYNNKKVPSSDGILLIVFACCTVTG